MSRSTEPPTPGLFLKKYMDELWRPVKPAAHHMAQIKNPRSETNGLGDRRQCLVGDFAQPCYGRPLPRWPATLTPYRKIPWDVVEK